MRAAVIDVGSNTIRMVIGDCRDGLLVPHRYERDVVRLAGDFTSRSELAEASMERAFTTLKSFRSILVKEKASTIRVIGTAALRRATNRQLFVDKLSTETNLSLEVISGDEEAQLTARGVLSVIEPAVDDAIIIDIGGGSTEFICVVDKKTCFQKSYPIGVVRLCEEFLSSTARQEAISQIVNDFFIRLKELNLDQFDYQIIGTAGTVTTLAAVDLGLADYDASKINNHKLSVSCLKSIKQKLEQLSVPEREKLIGMEEGRGDLILHGLDILLTVLSQRQASGLIVADAGLLEGAFLELCITNAD